MSVHLRSRFPARHQSAHRSRHGGKASIRDANGARVSKPRTMNRIGLPRGMRSAAQVFRCKKPVSRNGEPSDCRSTGARNDCVSHLRVSVRFEATLQILCRACSTNPPIPERLSAHPWAIITGASDFRNAAATPKSNPMKKIVSMSAHP